MITALEKPATRTLHHEGSMARPEPVSSSAIMNDRTERFDPLLSWRRAVCRSFGVVGFFSLVVNVLTLTMPVYLFQLSDRVLTSHSLDTLLMLSIVALGLIAVLSLLDILRRQILGRLAITLEATLGGPILASIIHGAPAGGGGNTSPLRSLHQVRSFIASPIVLLLFDAPLAPLYLAAIFIIHPHLGFVVLGSAVFLVAVALLNQWCTSAPLVEASQFASRADTQAEALARNAQVLNAMGMLNEGIQHWGRDEAVSLTHLVRGQERNYWVSGFSKFARLVTQILILGWGAYLAVKGELTGGMMIAASIIAGRGLQPLEGMIEGWRSVTQAWQAYGRVKLSVAAFQKEKARLLLPRPKGRLTVDKILYIPPGAKEPVLNGISFELKPGESLAVVGPSGSGKSTLAKILVGCLYPTAGAVRLDGTELRHWDRLQFGEFTGYLPQEVELFPGTIRENVCRMRNDLADSEVFAAAQVAGVHEMITSLSDGYETMLDRNGAPLSGGQKQRVALARAFFRNPALVVMDEPNSNLDTQGETALTETVRRAKQQGITIVVVTQRPALLNIVDKILILRSGRLESFGTPHEVLHRLVQGAMAQAKMTAPPSDQMTTLARTAQ
jgi:ATP-binding cassette subfamily C protein